VMHVARTSVRPAMAPINGVPAMHTMNDRDLVRSFER
jgi:hypothetical protein